jgi:hypothetical protein
VFLDKILATNPDPGPKGENLSGWTRLVNVTGPANTTIVLRHAEVRMLSLKGKPKKKTENFPERGQTIKEENDNATPANLLFVCGLGWAIPLSSNDNLEMRVPFHLSGRFIF